MQSIINSYETRKRKLSLFNLSMQIRICLLLTLFLLVEHVSIIFVIYYIPKRVTFRYHNNIAPILYCVLQLSLAIWLFFTHSSSLFQVAHNSLIWLFLASYFVSYVGRKYTYTDSAFIFQIHY